MTNLIQMLDGFIEIIHRPLGEKGEDAFAYNFARPDLHMQAVFDGCGGAGAWQYPEFNNATGAFISAQIISHTCSVWFKKLRENQVLQASSMGENFQHLAGEILNRLKNSTSPMGISGSLVKSFPCTASIAIISRDSEDERLLSLSALNCGDSRVYYLTPKTGLVQLTTDDSRGNLDPLLSLRSASPLSDMLNADKPFTIKSRQVSLTLPFAVMCATDGVFSYVRSPMDFEKMLLDCLVDGKDFGDFENRFQSDISALTGDDSTCLMSFYGWGNYQELRNSLQKRLEYLNQLCERMNRETEVQKIESAVDVVWNVYKKQAIYNEMFL